MVAQPTGMVTMLFTDIEGSTQLLEWLGRERYAESLDLHRRLLRGAFGLRGGYEVDCEGDAFFVAFSRAEDAVAAAIEAQQALAAAEWPEGQEFRVRMGIHTGEPLAVPPKYVGLDVHKAARIMAAGHGGQVLVSGATQRLVSGVGVLPLGEHRLKDLLQPEPICQLAIGGLPSEFPPLKTLGNRPTNLPMQPNPLIGRARQIGAATAILREEGLRLLTLTGPGGTGKTRLALQVAAELLEVFPSGVFFVSLAPIRDHTLALPTVAQTLAVREVAGEELADTLASYLEHKQMLLVLDNFEQVVEAAGELADLLRRCSKLKLLVTSRERLRLSAERVFEVGPLESLDPASADLEALLASEAVTLFLTRAQAVKSEFTLSDEDVRTVAEICLRLDGLPLALELAAARVGALTPRALLARLEHRLTLLTGGGRDANERQRTLRATIEWSYDLLTECEQSLFAQLSIFVDGCRLDSAEAVCDPNPDSGFAILEGLASLVDKNLIRHRADSDHEPRYWMLETIREYGLERLTAKGWREAHCDRHALHYLDVAERAKPELTGGDQVLWLHRIREDLANLRSAHSRFTDASSAEELLRLANALWRAQWLGGNINEARDWLQHALAANQMGRVAHRVEALRAAAFLAMWQGAYDEQSALAEEALALARLSGDGEALMSALITAGHAATSRSNYEAAESLLEESLQLARELRDRRAICMALGSLGTLYRTTRQPDRARQVWQESVPLIRAVGDRYGTAIILFGLAFVAIEDGEPDEAAPLLAEALALSNELDYREGIGYFLQGAAGMAAARGRANSAATILGRMRTLHVELGFKPNEDDRRLNAQIAETARAALGERAFEAAVNSGERMTLEQAVAYAQGA